MNTLSRHKLLMTPALVIALTILVELAHSQGTTQSAPPAGAANPSASRPAVEPGDDFVIGNDDVLAISVWKEPEVSRTLPVRSDGKISLPLVGDVQAAGKTPRQLQNELTASLHPYISSPEVTVIVQEIKSKRFNILGKIQRPGAYPLTPPMTVIDAIALAGGFTDFAKVRDIHILRVQANGTQTRLPFNYKQVISGSHVEQNVLLEPHDTIVVP